MRKADITHNLREIGLSRMPCPDYDRDYLLPARVLPMTDSDVSEADEKSSSDWKHLTCKLLNVARGDTDWSDFADDLDVDVEFERLRKMGWWDGDRPRVMPTTKVREKLLFYCEQRGITDPPYKKLRALFPRPKAKGVNPSLAELLSLPFLELQEAVTIHAGTYLFLLRDEDGKVVISNCELDRQAGEKSLPKFEIVRYFDGQARVVKGQYYSTENDLFLFGNRDHHRDLRVSIFKVERPASIDGRTPPQPVYRGLVTGVSWKNSIFTSRCLLIRREYAKTFFKVAHASTKKSGIATGSEDPSLPPRTPQTLDQLIGVFPIESIAGIAKEFGYLTTPDNGGVFFAIPPE
jgi:hypothetical protein